jgi:hypothetical protein
MKRMQLLRPNYSLTPGSFNNSSLNAALLFRVARCHPPAAGAIITSQGDPILAPVSPDLRNCPRLGCMAILGFPKREVQGIGVVPLFTLATFSNHIYIPRPNIPLPPGAKLHTFDHGAQLRQSLQRGLVWRDKTGPRFNHPSRDRTFSRTTTAPHGRRPRQPPSRGFDPDSYPPQLPDLSTTF